MRLGIRKFIPIIIISVLAVFFVLVLQISPLPPENIDIGAMQQGEYLLIKGKIVEGTGTYKGYSAVFEGENLLLTVNGSSLPFYSKDFDIKIHLPKSGIKEVYLTGKKGERILAWQAETVLVPPANTPVPTFGDTEFKALPSPTR